MSEERIFDADTLTVAAAAPRITAARVSCCGQHRHGDREHAPPCALTTAFASHLADTRHRVGGPPPRWLQCCRRPATGSTDTALPHLVAVRRSGDIVDRTVWEHLDRATLRRWLPTADDPDRWTAQLGQLHRLRAWLRGPQHTRDDARSALQAGLGDHYVSMRFVLEHPQLVRAALQELITERQHRTRIFVNSATIQALKIRNYRLFASGQIVSNTGTWMQRIAQDWLVLHLTHNSGLALGITSMLQALPMLVFGMWGGVIADRYPKRNVLLVTQAAIGGLAVIPGLLTLAGLVQTWQVYVLALGLGIATVFDQPTRQSFTIEMVGRDHLSAALAINSITFNAARVIGPGLAGFAIGWIGIGPMFLINAASSLAVIAGLAAMRPDELHLADPLARGKRQLRAGLSYVGGRVDLLLPITVIGIVSGFGQSFQVILPLLAKQNFQQAASGYGVLTAGLAIGSVVGAVHATRRKSPRMAVVVAAALTFGAFEIASGLAPGYWVCFAVLIPAGIAALTLNTSANASVQLGAGPGMRGRAMALYMLVLLSANSLGSLVLGAVAQQVGPAAAIAIGGGVVIVGTLLAVVTVAARNRTPLQLLLRTEPTTTTDETSANATTDTSPPTGSTPQRGTAVGHHAQEARERT